MQLHDKYSEFKCLSPKTKCLGQVSVSESLLCVFTKKPELGETWETLVLELLAAVLTLRGFGF